MTRKILKKCNALINHLLSINTRRRFYYKRFVIALEILSKEGWGSLWFQMKQVLKQTFLYHDKIDEITEEELADGRNRLMAFIHSMEQGGAQRCLSIVLGRIDRARIEPELVTVFDREIFHTLPDDIKIHVLEKQHTPVVPACGFILPQHLQRHAGTLAWIWQIACKLSEVINKRKPSVILAQGYFVSAILLLAKHGLIRSASKVIVSARNLDSALLSTDRSGELYTYLMRTLYNDADQVVAVTEKVAQDLRIFFGVQPEKIITIYNPIQLIQIQKMAEEEVTEHPWFTEEIPIILFAGRLVPQKGLNYLLKAISTVRQSMGIRCVLIGDGEEHDNLRQLAEKLGIGGDVLFLGRRKNPFKFMRRSTVVVLPSLFEGFGNAIVEAMAVGLPVIATDCLAEIIEDGRDGFIVPPKDETALASAISKLLLDGELRERFSVMATRRAKDFDAESIVKIYENLLTTESSEPQIKTPEISSRNSY